MLGSCSTLFGDRAEAVDGSGEPIQEEAVVEPEYSGPESIEDEFPFIRFMDHLDGTYTALITVPKVTLAAPADELPIETALKKYVPSLGEGGSASMERRQGYVFHSDNKAYSNTGKFDPVEEVLVIRGTEDDLREALAFIDVWVNSGPMIEIQAEVFETKRSDEFERGVEQIGTTPFFQDVQGKTFLKNLTGSFPSDTSNSGGVFSLGLLDSSFRIDAAVSLLAKEGFVDVLSRPRIITRNGVAAIVKSTEQIPYLSVTNAGNLAGAATFTVQRSPVGVTLTVTPFLVGADTVHLVISVEISTLGRDFDLGLDGAGNKISAPSLSSRSAQTEVYVRNGETVVIGGLILNEEQSIESRIPILGDLPFLGWLFSSSSESTAKTEVFFIIRPILKARPSIDPFGDFFDPFADQETAE